MPSPFPGMDPYLEDPALWPDVHHEIISVSREFLNAQLGPKYYVRIEERVYTSDEDDPGRSVIIPDLRIGERPNVTSSSTRPQGSPSTSTIEPMVIDTLLDDEIQEPRLEIVDRDERRLITVIEVVSPSNKVAGSNGRASYRQKRREIMKSPSHWVEIDLLRTGTPIVPRKLVSRGDYFVHVSRVESRPKGSVWPILLPQRLPAVDIPVKSDDAGVSLDLQRVLETAYDLAAYDRVIDYKIGPIVALAEEYVSWAEQILREKGLR